MAIRTVDASNVGEYVAERRAKGSEILNPEQLVAKADAIEAAKASDRGPKDKEATPGNPVIKAGIAETTSDAPLDPGKQEPTAAKPVDKAKAGTDPAVQKRIDELTRLRKEAEEFAEDEYNGRLRAEGRIQELERELAATVPVQPKAEELKEPDPKSFTDMGEFIKAERAYQAQEREKAIAKAREEERTRAVVERQNELLRMRIEKAKLDLPDFVEVIEAADRVKVAVPQHVQELIVDSDVGPQIAYHLAKHPDEQKRIFAMTPARGLAALGRIEALYEEKSQPQAEDKPQPKPIETTRAPAPIASLKSDGAATISADPASAKSFDEYKRLRYEQLRRKRH